MLVVGSVTWPFVVYAIGAFVLTFGLIGFTALTGQRHRELTTDERYESGLPPAGGLAHRFSIEFYLVAMIFVVFDLESVFIFAWAVVARDLGWAGYVEMAVFVGLLLVALAYVWLTGALDWGTGGRQRRAKRMRP
jgi:NADH-quinone oxidoreductase subunit A